jgi:hypothetical protein
MTEQIGQLVGKLLDFPSQPPSWAQRVQDVAQFRGLTRQKAVRPA